MTKCQEKTIKRLRKRVVCLQNERGQMGFEGKTDGYKARICLEEMCHFMMNEDDDFHRSYKDVPLEELVFYILEKCIHNDSTMSQFHVFASRMVKEEKRTEL